MKRHSFLIGAFLLAIGGFLAKAIGAIYKIPLANILGSNGMGVYHLIFPLYSLLLVLISSGISVAVSKMVSFERANNNRKNQITIFRVSVTYVFFLSIVFSTALILFNEPISVLQGNVNAGVGYFAIAPAIIFASLISVVRAYFQGLENMIPTSFSNVIEQIVKLVFGLLLANYFLPRGIEFAVFGAVLAVTISEFAAFILILINFLFHKRKSKYIHNNEKITSQTLTQKQIFKNLIKYSLPATLSSLIIPITAFLDSFMVINLLVESGQSSALATSLYGIHNGIVNTLISLPVIITIAISTAIVPNLSGLHAKNNESEVSFKSSFFIKITWVIALPCFVLLLLLAPDIVEILYSRGLTDRVIDEFEFAYKLLMVASVSVIYYAFLQTFTSILQSIGKPIILFYSLFFALIIRTIIIVGLISMPQLNIFGVIIANVVFLTIATLINLVALRNYVALKFNFNRLVLVPIFSATVMGIVVFAIKTLLYEQLSPLIYSAICGFVGIIIYLLLLYVLKIFNPKELKMFPKIKSITKSKRNVV